MSEFRNKTTKYNSYQSNNKSHSTLDIKHKEKIVEIDKKETQLAKLYSKIEKYTNDIEIIENTDINKLTIDDINKKATYKNMIDDLKHNIEIIKLNNDEIDYYHDNLDILDDYYSENINKNIKSDEINEIKDYNDLFKKKHVVTNNDKSQLYETYMKRVYKINEKKKINIIQKICPECNIEKIIHVSEGMIICKKCGHTEKTLLDTDKQNTKDKNCDNKPSLYKRINHLSELLNQFQAKESTDIDKEIYDKIKEELIKQRKHDYNKLNYKTMREVLKKLGLNKYYEHIHHIINELNGIPPPTISRDTEDKIKHYFKAIQKPFNLFKPKSRKNFSAYSSVIHKILELLDLDEYLIYFPLLKSREKKEEFDILWQRICEFNNYQFIPSI